jgi:thiol-disulfide isomerase/thioredoxin
MSCPKCGRPRGDGPECPQCGIVYAKFRPPTPSAPPPPPAAEEAPEVGIGSRDGAPWKVAIALAAAVAIVAIVVVRSRSARGPEPAGIAAAPAAVATAAIATEQVTPEPPHAAVAAEDAGAKDDPRTPAAPRRPEPAAPAAEPGSCAVFSADLAAPPPRPSISTAWFEGAGGFRRAVDEQSSSRAPVLLFFHVEWCPHCRRFVGEVLPSAEVSALGGRILKVKVNAEGSEDDRELARRYGVTSYPTFLVIPAPGQAPVRVAQWSSPRSFVESCEGALPDPAREHLERGISLARAGSNDEAAAELKAAASEPRLATTALDRLGVLALEARCFQRAVAIYDRVIEIDARYLGGRAYHLRGFARHRAGDDARALEDAETACKMGYSDSCTVAERARASGR